MLISISTATGEVVHGRLYTPEQIAAFPVLTPGNKHDSESQYRLDTREGPVVFDNAHGIGATPDNRNVLYKGFLAQLTPDKFIELVQAFHTGARTEDADRIERSVKAGYGIGTPTLYLDIDEYIDDPRTSKPPRISGHEGRARMLALKRMGVKLVYAQIHFLGWRARHIENITDFLEYLQMGIIKQESSKVIGSPLGGNAIFA